MKTMKQTFAVIILTLAVVIVNASEIKSTESFHAIEESIIKMEDWMTGLEKSDDSESKENTVVEIAVSNPDFSILVEAVSKAGLVEALSAEGPFTVFAPTNEAFKSLFSQLGVNGVGDLTVDQLMPILTYHVVAGKVMSTDLKNGEVGTLNEKNKLTVDLSQGVKINSSNVVAADIQGKNGVIHVIDRVLLPQ